MIKIKSASPQQDAGADGAKVSINRWLRDKLEQSGVSGSFIQTLMFKGYRFHMADCTKPKQNYLDMKLTGWKENLPLDRS